MTSQTEKEFIPSPLSTGGAGNNYENFVQSLFVLHMIIEKGICCFPDCTIQKIAIQGRYAGYQTDDCILFLLNTGTRTDHKLLLQIKKNVTITESDEWFKESIQAAWKDFNNDEIFNKLKDRIALVTSHLTKTDQNDVRTCLAWARHSVTAADFFQKVNTVGSATKKKKIDVFRKILMLAGEKPEVSDDLLWQFLARYEIIVVDETNEQASCEYYIRQASKTIAPCNVWNDISAFVKNANPSATVIERNNIPESLASLFHPMTASLRDAWERLNLHGKLILGSIQSDVSGVHVDRSQIVDRVVELVESFKVILVDGARGSGKSAIIKNYIDHIDNTSNVICLRAEDFNHSSLESMFHEMGVTIPLSEISTGFSFGPRHIFVIESLEKLLEINAPYAFHDFLCLARQRPTWKIIATCRSHAVQNIKMTFFQSCEIDLQTVTVPDFSDDDLVKLLEKVPSLQRYSSHKKIKSLIRNPFIAKVATKVDLDVKNLQNTESEFKNAVWLQVIAKDSNREYGINDRRRKTFIDVSVKRIKSLSYSVGIGDLDIEALSALEKDGLISFNDPRDTVMLSHDVLEDWALEAFINSQYSSRISPQDFYSKIGSERGIQRAFRFWLTDKIVSDCQEIRSLILTSLESNEVSRCWKDEIITAILCSPKSYLIFPMIKDQLQANDGRLYSRMCLILRCSCKIYDEKIPGLPINNANDFVRFFPFLLKPDGEVWKTFITFVLENKNDILGNPPYFESSVYAETIRVLHDYLRILDSDDTLKNLASHVSKWAFDQFQWTIEHKEGKNKQLESIVEIVAVLCRFVKEEILVFAESMILNTDIGDIPYETQGIVTLFLRESLMSANKANFCRDMPELAARLCFHVFVLPEKNKRNNLGFSPGRSLDVSEHFCIRDKINSNDYSEIGSFDPASGLKGPFFPLLQHAPRIGIDLIVHILNYCAEKYQKSHLDSGEKYVVDLSLNDGRIIKQFCSARLWFAHREHLSPYAPGLIQTALMALEKFIVELLQSDDFTPEMVGNLVASILSRSNSVMPTAVLASLATGFPNKFLDSALPFLRAKEFFFLDFDRAFQEARSPRLNLFGSGPFGSRDPAKNVYRSERQLAFVYPWRKLSLLDLAWQLQCSTCYDDVQGILKTHYSELNISTDQTAWKNWLHIMDINNAKIEKVLDSNRLLVCSTAPPETTLTPHEEANITFIGYVNRFIKLKEWVFDSLRKKLEIPDDFSSLSAVLRELNDLWYVFKNQPKAFAIYQEILSVGCAIMLRNFKDELDTESQTWCLAVVDDALNQVANDGETIHNKIDHSGGLHVAEILPSLFDLQNAENIHSLREKLSTLVVCKNGRMREVAGIAIRNYMWGIDSDFSEMCLRAAFQISSLSKEFYRRYPQRTEAEKDTFWATCGLFRESILESDVCPIPSTITFNRRDTWFLFPILNTIPFNNKTLLHHKLLDEAARCYLNLQERDTDTTFEAASDDFQTHYPLLLGDHCFYSEKRLSDFNFLKILIERLYLSHSAITLILSRVLDKASQNDCLFKFWPAWNYITSQLKAEFQSVAADNRKRRRTLKTGNDSLIASLLFVNYWPDNDLHLRQLHDLLAMNKTNFVGFIREMIKNPTVFDAFSKLYFSFPDIFDEDGLDVLTSNFTLSEANANYISSDWTKYHLECILSRIILHTPLSNVPRHKAEALILMLDAIVDKGSPCAFFLREHLFSRVGSTISD